MGWLVRPQKHSTKKGPKNNEKGKAGNIRKVNSNEMSLFWLVDGFPGNSLNIIFSSIMMHFTKIRERFHQRHTSISLASLHSKWLGMGDMPYWAVILECFHFISGVLGCWQLRLLLFQVVIYFVHRLAKYD